MDPIALAAHVREIEFSGWCASRYQSDVTEENILTPYQPSADWEVDNGMNVFFAFNGYWGVTLVKHTPKDIEWSLVAKVGDSFVCAPERLFAKVVSALGRDAYEAYREILLDDLDSARWCLGQACRELQKLRILASSYVCSGSSARLLDRLGIPVAQDWAFLFEHSFAVL